MAEAAAVSRSTASRALTGRGYVGAGVHERVRAAAQALGYVPDSAARHLKARVSRSIGVLVPDLRDPRSAGVAAGAVAQGRRSGYTVVLLDDGGAGAHEAGVAEELVALRVAGVVLAPVSPETTDYLTRQSVPVVEVGRRSAASRDAVVVDGARAACEVVEHLVGLGHRRTALLVDEGRWGTAHDRVAGYEAAHRGAGLRADRSLVVPVERDVEAARSAALALLERPHPPTALVAADRVLAEGAWRAAAQRGRRVPGDLSLAALDDAPWMALVDPAVTAVRSDPVALGAAAVRRLLERIADPGAPAQRAVLDAVVVHRGSTAPPGG